MANGKSEKSKGKKRPAWMDRVVIAGPDDPIYKGGLRVTMGISRPEVETEAEEGEGKGTDRDLGTE